MTALNFMLERKSKQLIWCIAAASFV